MKGRTVREHVGYWYPKSNHTYITHGCRCDGCTRAHNALQRRRWGRCGTCGGKGIAGCGVACPECGLGGPERTQT